MIGLSALRRVVRHRISGRVAAHGKKIRELFATAPSFLWLTLLLLIPTLIVVAIAFKPSEPMGGIGDGWTLDTVANLGNPSYPAIIWRTIWQSLATTVICVLFAIPVGYYMARVNESARRLLMVLTIVPFWICFIVRVFAWKYLLNTGGFLHTLLVNVGMILPDTKLLDNAGTVLLVMVYNHLPFAVLPIFAAAEKFDFQFFEAAMDLGATRLRAFLSVFIPGIKSGIITATIMVLIPALGEYVIPQMVGSHHDRFIGNEIVGKVFESRNLPQACALASALIAAIIGLMLLKLFAKRSRKGSREIAAKGESANEAQ